MVTYKEFCEICDQRLSDIFRRLDVGQRFALWYSNLGLDGDTEIFIKPITALKESLPVLSLSDGNEDDKDEAINTRYTVRPVLIVEIKNGDVLVIDSSSGGWDDVNTISFSEWSKMGGKKPTKEGKNGR